MLKANFKTLLEKGVHFGHLKEKWNPNMAPYILMERNNIHIIDLNKTIAKLEDSTAALKQIAKSGKKILFVATKKQAKEIVAMKLQGIQMPYITERWAGGMLTNFPTIRKTIKKMLSIDKMEASIMYKNLSKREKLQIARQKQKLQKNLGSIAEMTKLPAALFVIDVMKEKIAVQEANRLGIPVFAMVDTNSNPTNIDFVIPSNDDASDSISVIMDDVVKAINEGLEERKAHKEMQKNAQKDQPKKTTGSPKKETTKKTPAPKVSSASKKPVKKEAAGKTAISKKEDK